MLVLCPLMCFHSNFSTTLGDLIPNSSVTAKQWKPSTYLWLLLQSLINEDLCILNAIAENMWLNLSPYLFLSQYQKLPLQNEPASSEESFGIPGVRGHEFQGRVFRQLVNGQFLAGSREH